jgi:siroheme synthase-like protein
LWYKYGMKTYPLCLVRLEEQRTVVIGGGKVAARKTESLLEAGAIVAAISPVFSDEFEALAKNAPLERIERSYQDGDLEGAFLVIAATDDPQINHAIWEEARRRGCLINVVDDPQHSNFIVPAIVHRDPIKIAITTGGASPALARRLRERLETAIPPDIGDLAELLAELRPELRKRFSSAGERLRAALILIEGGLDEALRTSGRETAKRIAYHLLDSLESGDLVRMDESDGLPPEANLEDDQSEIEDQHAGFQASPSTPLHPLPYPPSSEEATGRQA